MTAYVSVHGEAPIVFGNAPTYGIQTLGSPVPPSGSLGSLKLSTTFPVQFRVGDRLTVKTGGIEYVYYSSVEVLTSYNGSVSLAVYPAIQTTHSVGDNVIFPLSDVLKYQAINAIVSVNYNSADVSVPGAVPTRRRRVLPWIRAWPWTTDSYGLSWDQPNIMALMLKPVQASVDFDNATAGQPWNIPVPRVIGSEYTKFTPRSLGQASGYYRTGATSTLGPALADYDTLFPTEYRDAVSVRSRSTLSSLRQLWFPRPQRFSFDVADPDTVPNGSFTPTANSRTIYGPSWQLIRMASDTPNMSGTSQETAYGVGARGGRYSICGYYYDNTLGGPSGFAVEVRAIVPGLGDILINSIACTSGPTAFTYGPVATGTWSGVVLPTDASGTCAEFYLLVRVANPGSISLTYGSHVVIADSTQVPWSHHVVTGNEHAPGGLIAPFY